MESLEQIKARIELAVPGARIETILNESPSAQQSLLVDRDHLFVVAQFVKNDPALLLDYASNVTGVDWPDTITKT